MQTRSKTLSLALTSIAAVVLVVASSNIGHAITYVQTSDDCTGGCGTSSSNTVTITNPSTGVIDISVSLASGFNFLHSGFPGSFGFGLSSGFTSVNFIQGTTTWSTTGWTPANSPISATTPQAVSGTSQSWDGSGTFTNGYAMTWNAGNGIAHEDGTTLDFEISATGLTLSSFLADSTGSFFTADVAGTGQTCNVDGCTRNTGIIDFTLAPTPLPAAALLFGPVLGVGYFGLRRRRRKLALAAR